MKWTDKLNVLYHDRMVGKLCMTPDNSCCAFQYDKRMDCHGLEIICFIASHCEELLVSDYHIQL